MLFQVLLLGVVLVDGAKVSPIVKKFPGGHFRLASDAPFSISCVVENSQNSEAEVRWFRNEDEITGSSPGLELLSGNKLAFQENVESILGWYHCEATNPLGKAKSEVVEVGLTKPEHPDSARPPQFDVEPKVEVEQLDSSVTFRCSAHSEGSPEPQIIWSKNGEVLEESLNQQELSLDRISESDVGVYACNASNSIGYVYKMVYLNILTRAPFFVETPRTQQAAIGEDIFMRCHAKGYPKPSISWTFNGEQINTESHPNMEQTDRGDLRIRRVEESSYGVYACTAENELDKKTIQGNLTTVAPITIEEGPGDMTVQIHSTVRMNCSVLYDPKYGLDITWKKDNVEVQLGGRFSLTDQNQLVIEDVAFNDAGAYTCVATTSQGRSSDHNSGTLNVKGIPPKLVNEPTDQTVTEGTTVVLTCQATADPPAQHFWIKNVSKIPLDEWPRHRMDPADGTLTIYDTVVNDSGNYICRADNGHGPAAVGSARVDIRKPTKVLVRPESAELAIGSNYTLPCVFETDKGKSGSIEVSWTKDDLPLQESLNPWQEDEESSNSPELEIPLEIDIDPKLAPEEGNGGRNSTTRFYTDSSNTLYLLFADESSVGEYACSVRTPVDHVVLRATIYDPHSYSLLWLLLVAVLVVSFLCLLCVLFWLARRRARSKGRYGVKDVADGKGAALNRSDVPYSVDDVGGGGDLEGGNGTASDALLENGGDSAKKSPIYAPKDPSSKKRPREGSESSLLNLTDEELWLRKGMDEDGSFREGRYAE